MLSAGILLSTAGLARSADAGDGCSGGIFNRQGCAEAKHGSIKVRDARNHADTTSESEEGEGSISQAALDASVKAQYCADATANAAAAGGAPVPIVELCRGIIALPVAPSREQVLTAFRELPLYRGAIRTDPRTFTLVNLDTYFWCGDGSGRGCELIGEGERQVVLLGQPVRIRPKILSYSWRFGDGTGQQVEAGKAVHTYRHAGSVEVTLTLTWTADYALGGGAFQPIDDTTTTTSPPRVLPVREAQAVIVDGD
jgi:hypothetical protein